MVIVLALVLGLVVGLGGGDCSVNRSDFDFGIREVVELRGSSVEEFNLGIGVFDIDADLVVIVDWVNEGISRGYWFKDDCLVEVRVLDTGFGN